MYAWGLRQFWPCTAAMNPRFLAVEYGGEAENPNASGPGKRILRRRFRECIEDPAYGEFQTGVLLSMETTIQACVTKDFDSGGAAVWNLEVRLG